MVYLGLVVQIQKGANIKEKESLPNASQSKVLGWVSGCGPNGHCS